MAVCTQYLGSSSSEQHRFGLYMIDTHPGREMLHQQHAAMPCIYVCDHGTVGGAYVTTSLRVLSLQEAKLYASGQSVVGPSPSTSLKRDRLMHRNAILRRTGFLEGTHRQGSIAGALFCPAHCQGQSSSSAAELISCLQHL